MAKKGHKQAHKKPFTPSQERIKKHCERFKQKWSEDERIRRGAWMHRNTPVDMPTMRVNLTADRGD